MENKLIPMTEFILQQEEIRMQSNPYNEQEYDNDFIRSVNEYAKFLSQPLTLGMFIPCDDNDEPIERPDLEDYIFEEHPELPGNPKEYDDDAFQKDYDVYEQACERVLFEGFEVKIGGLSDTVINKKLSFAIYVQPSLGYTIETLCNKNLTLTATAIKSIYGS
ncbi:hypothetical protein CMU14_13265 [Elizabethkingia anophelis]|nr:hypothetical protein [Elizabethkingia anophelis]